MPKFRRVVMEVNAYQNLSSKNIYLKTEHGKVAARPTDWVITGCLGERYPCSDKVFRLIYAPTEEV